MTGHPEDVINKNEKISLKPSTLLTPVPVVLISCQGNPDGAQPKPNLITVAWAGTINSEPPMVSISVRKSRYSHAQIMETREFVVNLVDQNLLQATDFCGVKSGQSIDKFAACQLTPIVAEKMQIAPAVAESPLTLSCHVTQVIELPSHDLFLAEIIAVQVRPNLFDRENRLRLDRAKLVAYAHGDYYSLGQQLGFFGYSIARPEVLQKRMNRTISKTTKKNPHRR
ncbi:MAG: flavin reductase family protein [Eubacteriales bacterium]|nr:flavin reductase family protein [Eubacteriales bacterium]